MAERRNAMSPTIEGKITFELTRPEAEAIRRLLQGRRDYLKGLVSDQPDRQRDFDIADSAFSYISAKLRPHDE